MEPLIGDEESSVGSHHFVWIVYAGSPPSMFICWCVRVSLNDSVTLTLAMAGSSPLQRQGIYE